MDGIWSERSLLSGYVRDEATYALEQKKLVPVAIETVDVPFRFKRIHTLNLQNWDGSSQSLEFRKLIEDIFGLLGEPQNLARTGLTQVAGQRAHREQETSQGAELSKRPERGSKLNRLIGGLVAMIFASAGAIVYLYTRPLKISDGNLIKVERQIAYNLIQSGSQKAWFTCMQFKQLKLKERGSAAAKQIGDTNLEQQIKKQIRDHRKNIDDALSEYSSFLIQLADAKKEIVAREFDEYTRSLEKRDSFEQIQLIRLMKLHYDRYLEGKRGVNCVFRSIRHPFRIIPAGYSGDCGRGRSEATLEFFS